PTHRRAGLRDGAGGVRVEREIHVASGGWSLEELVGEGVAPTPDRSLCRDCAPRVPGGLDLLVGARGHVAERLLEDHVADAPALERGRGLADATGEAIARSDRGERSRRRGVLGPALDPAIGEQPTAGHPIARHLGERIGVQEAAIGREPALERAIETDATDPRLQAAQHLVVTVLLEPKVLELDLLAIGRA